MVILFQYSVALLTCHRDNLNPKFVKSFTIEYHFHRLQPLRFEVYDIENEKAPLSKQDYIGFAVSISPNLCFTSNNFVGFVGN